MRTVKSPFRPSFRFNTGGMICTQAEEIPWTWSCVLATRGPAFVTVSSNSAGPVWELYSPDEQVLLVIREGEEKLIGWEHELASYLDESFSFVGRAHAYIGVDQDGNAYIIDNGSKNGVQVNCANIEPNSRHMVQEGDYIDLGDKMLTNDRRAAHFQIRKRVGG